jgi:hypothetical protein
MKLAHVVTLAFLTATALGSAVALAGEPAVHPSPVASDDPTPAPITVLTSSRDLARGLIFVTPTGAAAPPLTNPGDGGVAPPPGTDGGVAPSETGPEIIDNQGRPVWFLSLAQGLGATDFRVQRYRGEPVVTWIQSAGGFSTGPTVDIIADRHYHTIATVSAGNGLIADTHEFRLTNEGTALITVYNTIPYDLSSVGGPTNGKVTEGVVQEIDIATGAVLFEWHSLDHVGLDESHQPLPATAAQAWDYFHINAVNPDLDGNLIISSRHTWTVYKLDRHTGAVIWRLGGKKTDFDLGPGVAFAWQHNPLPADGPDTLRIFDNEAGTGAPVLPYSRVIWVHHDDRKKTATLERWFKHPDNLLAASQGNSQALDNGDTFVGWGQVPRISEFDRDGKLVWDAQFAGGDTYRAYRHVWVGEPDTIPAVKAEAAAGGTTVHAIWNGATRVARWEILGSARAGHALSWIDSVEWNGLDTAVTVPGTPATVQVVARDDAGRELGRSDVTSTGN